jgi:nitric oxide reductase large subunit
MGRGGVDIAGAYNVYLLASESSWANIGMAVLYGICFIILLLVITAAYGWIEEKWKDFHTHKKMKSPNPAGVKVDLMNHFIP